MNKKYFQFWMKSLFFVSYIRCPPIYLYFTVSVVLHYFYILLYQLSSIKFIICCISCPQRTIIFIFCCIRCPPVYLLILFFCIRCPPENECVNGHHTCLPSSEICIDATQGYRYRNHTVHKGTGVDTIRYTRIQV